MAVILFLSEVAAAHLLTISPYGLLVVVMVGGVEI